MLDIDYRKLDMSSLKELYFIAIFYNTLVNWRLKVTLLAECSKSWRQKWQEIHSFAWLLFLKKLYSRIQCFALHSLQRRHYADNCSVVFINPRALQYIKLAVDQVWLGKVVLSSLCPLSQQGLWGIEKEEVHERIPGTIAAFSQDVPVGSFQCRTCNDEMVVLGLLPVIGWSLLVDCFEPPLAVRVGQWLSSMHFVDVGFWVKLPKTLISHWCFVQEFGSMLGIARRRLLRNSLPAAKRETLRLRTFRSPWGPIQTVSMRAPLQSLGQDCRCRLWKTLWYLQKAVIGFNEMIISIKKFGLSGAVEDRFYRTHRAPQSNGRPCNTQSAYRFYY